MLLKFIIFVLSSLLKGHLHLRETSPGHGWQNAHVIFVIFTSFNGTSLLMEHFKMQNAHINFLLSPVFYREPQDCSIQCTVIYDQAHQLLLIDLDVNTT